MKPTIQQAIADHRQISHHQGNPNICTSKAPNHQQTTITSNVRRPSTQVTANRMQPRKVNVQYPSETTIHALVKFDGSNDPGSFNAKGSIELNSVTSILTEPQSQNTPQSTYRSRNLCTTNRVTQSNLKLQTKPSMSNQPSTSNQNQS